MMRISLFIRYIKRGGFAFLFFGGAVSAHSQPLQSIWERNGLSDSARYGRFVTSLGDQNDDGFDDWAVTASAFWYANPQDAYVEFFHGGNPPPTIPYYRIEGSDSIFKTSYVRNIGDINGDGFLDWVLQIWPEENGPGLVDYFYLGGPNHDLNPDYALNIGYQDRILAMRDFNGDGFDDLFLASTNAGIGQIFFGGDAMDFEPDWAIHDDPPGSQSSLPWGFGDLNGDLYADVTAGPDNEIWIYFGGANPDTLVDIVFTNLGNSPHPRVVRDLNGDTADELLIGLAGQINVYFGGEDISATPDVSLSWPGGCLAFTLATGGDFNHDTFNDLLAIDPSCPGASGMFAIYLGYQWLNPLPVATVYGRGQFDLIGISSTAALGDINGDNIDDFIIGATNLDNDGKRGKAVIIAGDSNYIVSTDDLYPPLPQQLEISVYPNPFNSQTTIEFQLPLFQTHVEFKIFNTLGQQVKQHTFFTASRALRYHLDARDLPSGVFFLHASTNEFFTTIKLMILK